MLQLDSAQHILEVACGTGKLLPMAVDLKAEEATFLATDLSKVMLQTCKQTIQTNLAKMGVPTTLEEWLQKKHLEFKIADATKKVEAPYKFDRIIANLVLHMVPDPAEMLKTLGESAEPGCLLGVTVWGPPEKNNFFGLLPEARKAKGEDSGLESSPHHLAGKLRQLGEESGLW
jgi:SAM-dependent methyltransferase